MAKNKLSARGVLALETGSRHLSKTLGWPRRALTGPLDFMLRGLAAPIFLHMHHIKRGNAVKETAIRAKRCEISSGNERDAGQNCQLFAVNEW